ncbi:MAG TPA: restriction endonuclease subunit S [Trebonia sp.]|nr:restriction endonuclease subunit S [Trebonia sp.]
MARGDWREVRIGDLGRVVTGFTPRAAWVDSWGDAVDFITPGDQAPGRRWAIPARRLSAPGARRLATRLLPAGATCVTCIGETIGKTSRTTGPAVTNQQINSVIPDPAAVDPAFLYYLLTAHGPRLARAAGGSAARIVNKRQFAALAVALPPRPEQERAAAVLGVLDDKLAANARTAATALALADALFDAYPRPGPGRPRRLGDLADVRYGRALPLARRAPGTVPVYGSSGVVGAHDRALVAGPGIVVGRKGTVGAVHWSQCGFFPIDTTFFIKDPVSAVPAELLFLALRRLPLAALRSDSAVPGLTRASLLAAQVEVPAGPGQGVLTAQVSSLFAARDAVTAESAGLRRLRDALLPGLVLGQPVPEPAPVEF